MIEIEKGIPIPDPQSHEERAIAEAVEKMTVGDSFVVSGIYQVAYARDLIWKRGFKSEWALLSGQSGWRVWMTK
jgi:hypothetical protein